MKVSGRKYTELQRDYSLATPETESKTAVNRDDKKVGRSPGGMCSADGRGQRSPSAC